MRLVKVDQEVLSFESSNSADSMVPFPVISNEINFVPLTSSSRVGPLAKSIERFELEVLEGSLMRLSVGCCSASGNKGWNRKENIISETSTP